MLFERNQSKLKLYSIKLGYTWATNMTESFEGKSTKINIFDLNLTTNYESKHYYICNTVNYRLILYIIKLEDPAYNWNYLNYSPQIKQNHIIAG